MHVKPDMHVYLKDRNRFEKQNKRIISGFMSPVSKSKMVLQELAPYIQENNAMLV